MRAGNEKPINKLAAIQMSKGFEYKPIKKIQTIESKNPLPTRKPLKSELNNKCFLDLTGYSFGRFIVIGKYKDGKGWVCRCSCGKYCVRMAKATLNKNNVQDRCEECRHLAYLKAEDQKRRTGKDVDIRDF